jgi:AcrR family transcriptional regulator
VRDYHPRVSSAERRAADREERESTRREIMTATDRFLRERPYRELSVEALMTQAGLTREAFYAHFDDVTDLILSLLTEVGAELYAVAERWLVDAQVTQTGAVGSGLPAHVWLRAIVEFFARNGPLVGAISEAATTDERIERAYNGFLDRYTELTAIGLEYMIRQGLIEPLDPWPVARALNLMNERYLLSEFGRGSDGDPELALTTLETIWVRALAPRDTERRDDG